MAVASYSGAGNTFLLGDNREGSLDISLLLSSLSPGEIDGLVCAEPSSTADISMRIYNRDGSEAAMCGNGIRCLIHFLRTLGVEKPIYHIDTQAGLHRGWFVQEEICVELPPPTDLRLSIGERLHMINTGVPHAVLFVDALEPLDVLSQGRVLRHSPLFAPAGANVNFTLLQEDGSLAIRTYERGVEGETLACGTGATAAALIAHRIYHLPSPLSVSVRSGDTLHISFTPDWGTITMQGPVYCYSEKEMK